MRYMPCILTATPGQGCSTSTWASTVAIRAGVLHDSMKVVIGGSLRAAVQSRMKQQRAAPLPFQRTCSGCAKGHAGSGPWGRPSKACFAQDGSPERPEGGCWLISDIRPPWPCYQVAIGIGAITSTAREPQAVLHPVFTRDRPEAVADEASKLAVEYVYVRSPTCFVHCVSCRFL
jgi:hypothetical protein